MFFNKQNKAIKEAVSIPVLAANLIRSPEQAEAQLKELEQYGYLIRHRIRDSNDTINATISFDVNLSLS